MTISVDIADRLYDYTDEEVAAEAVAAFQFETGLNDDAVITLWSHESDPRYRELEKRIIDAVDSNGSVKRAQENVPGGISLCVAAEAPAS